MDIYNSDDNSQRAMEIQSILGSHFYPPFVHAADRLGPLSELIYCILSQRTLDELADRAFRKLTGSIWSWTEARDMPPRRLITLISDATWPEEKAKYIRECLIAISDWSGWNNPSLDFLAELPDEEVKTWLRRLYCVGAKTTAAVMLFSTLRRAALPVDTHYYRSAGRLGLIPADCGEEQAHKLLREQLPTDWKAAELERQYYLMKGLGQQFCRAKYPNCRSCPVAHLCAFNLSGTKSTYVDPLIAISR